jgi:hypothetical protein
MHVFWDAVEVAPLYLENYFNPFRSIDTILNLNGLNFQILILRHR